MMIYPAIVRLLFVESRPTACANEHNLLAGGISSDGVALQDVDNTLSGSPSGRTPDDGSECDRPGLSLLSGLLVVAAVVAGLIACFAAVRRGLDLTDESYYIVSELHAKSDLKSSSEFQLLLGPILSFVRYIWILRVVRLVGLMIANGFFAWSFLKTAPSLIGARFQPADRIAIGGAITASGLMLSVYLPQTPGYNDVTVFILACAASLFLLLADQRISDAKEPAAWATVGVLIWFQLLVKWPSLIAILPLAALAMFRSPPRPRGLLRCHAAVLSGALLAALFTQLLLAPLPDLFKGLRQGSVTATTAQGQHQVLPLLARYVDDLWNLMGSIVSNYWYLLLAAIATGLLVALAAKRYARLAGIVSGLGLGLLTPVLALSGRAAGGVQPYNTFLPRSSILPLYVVFAFLAGATALIFHPNGRLPARALLVLGALLAMPLLSALGTSNHLWFNALFLSSFWVAAALAIASAVPNNYARPLVCGLTIAFATLIAFTAFDGTWLHPYRQAPLSEDAIDLTSSGPLDGLQVDPSTARFFREVRAEVNSSVGSLPPTMVVWAGVAGVALASADVQPTFAWVTQGTPLALKALVESCRDQSRGILLLTPRPIPDLVRGTYALPPVCSQRTWTTRPNIDLPTAVGGALIGGTTIRVYFARPIVPSPAISRTTSPERE
jgi:hypothetical protein